MEYFIAFFVGIWISAAGLLAYRRICKDDPERSTRTEGKNK